MKLEMLAKDTGSGDEACDSCYLGDDVKVYVQAGEAAPDVYEAAENLLPGERIVRLNPQVILDAADRLRGPRVSMLPPGAPEFSVWFRQFRRSCFRLETLQCYRGSGEDDSIRAFLAGQTPQPHPGKRRWMTLVGAATRGGRTMRRVHVVTEPLTDYLRFEVAWSYAHSVAAGEDVRIIPLAEGQAWPADIPLGDFWLFDDTELFDMRYDADGTWLGVAHLTDSGAAQVACQQREAAWRLAQPWSTYVSERPELAQRVPIA